MGLVLPGEEGTKLLMRAKKCPFFIQPVFRQDGFFTLVSQFQSPSYFLLAYLEDYRVDASKAQPLVTFAVYDEVVPTHNVALVRGQVINKGIQPEEGEKVIHRMIDVYSHDDEFENVRAFNQTPDSFDFDDYISRQNAKWHEQS